MFLGIGPGEFLLILVIVLLVVGPERMPEFARQAGRMIVQVRNWMQRSPDAAMVLRARQEIEQELASLRSSLLEVQSVRNEMLEAARTVNQTITSDVLGETRQALGAAQGVPGTVGRRPNGAVVTVPEPDPTGSPASALAEPQEPAVAPPDVPATLTPEAAPTDQAIPTLPPPQDTPATTQIELAALRNQLDLLAADLTMLRRDLARRGLLGDSPAPGQLAGAPTTAQDEERE